MTTTPLSALTSPLRPFRAHRLHPSAVAAIERELAAAGAAAAQRLAERIAAEFEDVYLRDAAAQEHPVYVAVDDCE